MKQFADKIAVVTGGGTGMGRELVRQLTAEGCNVAMCDLFAQAMAVTKLLCEATRLPQGLRITIQSTIALFCPIRSRIVCGTI
jgi:NAD(P)-dependent dehydrogenase (short-subunit alcohol dehydrogenase family)